MVTEVTARNFKEEVLSSKIPVLVDFWAAWCGPCKSVAPIIDALSEEYKDKIKFAKVNVDNSPDLAAQYGIMSIPTILILNEGKVVTQTVGAQSKSQFKKSLDGALKKK
jgi:thioredoxin 1